MIVFVNTQEQAVAADGEYRAGGTELQERRRQGIATGPLIDLRDLTALRGAHKTQGGGMRLGAGLRIAELARMPEIVAGYPGLAEAAGGLATPQIRAVGTVAGNLLQRTRCWYYRSAEAKCLKKGGSRCYARDGDHLYHSCFDPGSCVSVHPSTLGMVLLAYDGRVEVHGAADRTVAELYGDGSDARRDHHLENRALVTAVVLPPPRAGEQAAYFRAISRARSEWPLVECVVRLVVERETISEAAVAVGGVAPRPMRLPSVEAALRGQPAGESTLVAAAARATEGTSPLPMTGYKVPLLERTVLETAERALQKIPTQGGPPPKPTKAGRVPAAASTRTAESTKDSK